MKKEFALLFFLLAFHLLPAQESLIPGQEKEIGIIFENGLLAGHPNGVYSAAFSSHLVFSWPIDQRIQIGGGSGAEIIGKTFIPLFADVRLIPFRTKPLFLYGKAGYALCLNSHYDAQENGNSDYIVYPDYYYPNSYYHQPHPFSNDFTTQGGLLIESGIGVLLQAKKLKMGLSIGYRYQQTEDRTVNFEHPKTFQNYFHRLALRISFWF